MPNVDKITYTQVSSPGAEGTINLFFGDYCLCWVNNEYIARRLTEILEEKKSGREEKQT